MMVIAGKNNIAVHALEKLVEYAGLEKVIALPNATDNGLDSWQRSFKKRASELGVTVSTLEEVQARDIDLFISLEYDRIIKPQLLKTTKLYNMHFSELPRYKGMYTSIWPILNGDTQAGVTLHEIDSGIDTGSICGQKLFDVPANWRSRDLYTAYIVNAIALFDQLFEKLVHSSLEAHPQSAEHSSYYSKRSLNFTNLTIDLNVTAWQLQRQIYAYCFREYQLPLVNGCGIVNVELTGSRSQYAPGTVVSEGERSFTIATVDYDAVLYIDSLDEVLNKVPTASVKDLKRLLKNIAGIHDRNDRGWSPIIVAAYHGNMRAIEYLLSEGARVNDQNHNGTSVLMYAKNFCVQHGENALFIYLRDQGADVDIRDHSGKCLKDYLTSQEITLLGL